MIPLWGLLAIGSALCMVGVLLTQEKFKTEGFTLSFWIKVCVSLVALPFAWKIGFPTDIWFYIYIGATAVLYCVSDVIYFRAVPQIGSGLMTRVMPVSLILSFILWLAIDHDLLAQYIANPAQAAGITAAMLLAALSIFFLKRCAVSWQGVRLIWFCIFSACVGPILTKLGLNHATAEQATFSYVVIQGGMMVVLWLIYFVLRKPVTSAVLFAPKNIRAGIAVGILSTGMLMLKTEAFVLAENPAYVLIFLYTDALWVMLVYKLIGRRENSNIWAGLGIVASAILLIFFKSL
jgi:hypothetical protein